LWHLQRAVQIFGSVQCLAPLLPPSKNLLAICNFSCRHGDCFCWVYIYKFWTRIQSLVMLISPSCRLQWEACAWTLLMILLNIAFDSSVMSRIYDHHLHMWEFNSLLGHARCFFGMGKCFLQFGWL
jgi:hypothetical protein